MVSEMMGGGGLDLWEIQVVESTDPSRMDFGLCNYF